MSVSDSRDDERCHSPCTRQDLERVLELDKLWNEEGVSYVWYGNRDDLVADFEQFPTYFLVAERDGWIVGYVNGSLRSNETVKVLRDREAYLEVENIYVVPEFRNGRIGGDLLEKLLEVAAENGVERFVVSTVTRDIDRIIRFYRGYGFKPWHVEFFK